MTRLLVVSDSHGTLARYLPRLPWQEADQILFAGDGYDEAVATLQAYGLWERTVAVAGNCDRRPAFAEAEITVEGWPIWLVHGDKWGVKAGYDTITAEARRRGARVVVFGHSHKALHLEQAGVHLFNPGSPIEPRGGTRASVGWIELDGPTAHFAHLPV